MHRVVSRGAPVRAALVLCIFAAMVPEGAFARSVRVLVCDVPPNAAYDARVNNVTRGTIASSPAGTLSYTFDAGNGNLVSFVPSNLAPPPPPLFPTASADGPACARVAWLPSGDPSVVGYVVYAGTRSVASGDAPAYDVSQDAGGAAAATVCQLPAGVNYVAVRAKNFAGMLSAYSAERTVTVTPGTPTPVPGPAHAFALAPNHPNPFNPVTQIPFTLDRATRVTLRVFDVRGALVATLVDGKRDAGAHRVAWEARDDAGRALASGVYLCVLEAGGRRLQRKMVLLK